MRGEYKTGDGGKHYSYAWNKILMVERNANNK